MPFVAAIATWTASIRAFGGSAPVRSSVFARAPRPATNRQHGNTGQLFQPPGRSYDIALPRFHENGPRYKQIEAASTCPPFSRDLPVR